MYEIERWPEPNAGWCDGMFVEACLTGKRAYLALDFFPCLPVGRVLFASQRNVPQGGSKKDKRKIRCACPTSGGNTFEVLVSQPSQGYGLAGFGEPNELIK